MPLPTPPLAALTPLQATIIVSYFALLIAIAFAFRKLNKDADDYFRSGCQGTWWLVGMSVYMASFSAYTFTGIAGVAFEAGFSSLVAFIANVIGFALNGLFLAAWLRQLRVTTAPEVIRDRFGVWTEQIYSWIGNLFGLLYAAMTLYTVSIFAATVFGLPLRVMIVAIGVTVLLYSLIGGRWAVMGADFVQGLILVPITFLLAFLALREIGGPAGFVEAIRSQGLAADFHLFKAPQERFQYNYTVPWVIASILALMMDRASLTAAPRYFSAKDGGHARGAAWLVTILMAASMLAFFLPPIVARLLCPEEVAAMAKAGISKPAETAYAVISMRLLPESLMGLMLVAIFAATMSTMDSGLNQFAAVFIKNIYPALARLTGHRPMVGRALFRLGEFFTLLSGAAVIALALYFAQVRGQGAFEIMLTLGALFGIPMAVPMTLGLFTPRAPTHAAAAAVLTALPVAAVGLFLRWTYDLKVFATLAAGIVGYFAACAVRERAPDGANRVAAFYDRMHRPVDFLAEVGDQGGDRAQARILGGFSIVTAAGVLCLLLVPAPWSLAGRGGILLIAAVEAGVGLLLFAASRRPFRRPAA